MRTIFNIAALYLIPSLALATSFVRPYGSADYAAGTKAVGTKVNAEFAYISSWLNNGNIASANIATLGVLATNLGTGSVITSKLLDGNVTNIKLADSNTKFTAGSGVFATGGGPSTLQLITNLSTTISTVGRPVRVSMQTSGDLTNCTGSGVTRLGYLTFDGSGGEADLYVIRDSQTTVASFLNTNVLYRDCSAYSYVDNPATGTHTYSARISLSSGLASLSVCNCKLVVQEL